MSATARATPTGGDRPAPGPPDLVTEPPEVTGGSHGSSARIEVTVDDLVTLGSECRHSLSLLQAGVREVRLAAQAALTESVAATAVPFLTGSPTWAAVGSTVAPACGPTPATLARIGDLCDNEAVMLHLRLESLTWRLEFAAKSYAAAEAFVAMRWIPVDALVSTVAQHMAAWYPGQTAAVSDVVALPPAPAPRGVIDLVQAVVGVPAGQDRPRGEAGANGFEAPEPPSGRVDVWPLPAAGCYLVALAGTSRWDPPWRAGRSPDVRTLQANLQLMSGHATAEVAALPGALERAGVPPGATLVLSGHSQGGLTAMAAAASLATRYRVSHVVTAGSPVAGLPVPEGVRVLSLEHRSDVVPRLDGHRNAGHPHHVTVRVGRGGIHPLTAHDVRGYVAAAGWVDSSPDPTLADFRRSLAQVGVAPEQPGHPPRRPGTNPPGTRVVLEIQRTPAPPTAGGGP